MVEFHRVAELLRDFEFMTLNNHYQATVSDNPTTFTMAVMHDTRKTIRNYASAGPTKLWAIEELMDGLLNRVRWDIGKKGGATKSLK